MSKDRLNYDEIQDQHLDTMIKLAFKYANALESQEIMEACENMECPVNEACVKSTYNMFLDKLAKQRAQETRQSRIVQFRRIIPRVIQIAACLILVLGIATPFAVANVETVRVKVMQLLIDIQEDHTELAFVEDEDAKFYIPAGWSGLYYPSYIPDGFVMTEMSQLYCDVTFVNKNGAKIYFSEYLPDDLVDINSENAALSYAVINGKNTFIVEHDNFIIVTWASEDRFFVIEAETTKEEALLVAEGVRKISFEN